MQTRSEAEGLVSLQRHGLRVPKRKPRRLWRSASFRIFYLLQRIVPDMAFARALLYADSLVRRLAWEQVSWALDEDEAFSLLRPHTLRFLEETIPPGSRIVDIGGGRGPATAALAPTAGHVLYVDKNPHHVVLAVARCAGFSNAEFVTMDAEREEIAGQFDFAVVLSVLEHLDDPVGFLKALRRSAREVIIEVPDFTGDPLNLARWRFGVDAFTDDDHRSEFTLDELADVLAQSGWESRQWQRRNGVIFAHAVHAGWAQSTGVALRPS